MYLTNGLRELHLVYNILYDNDEKDWADYELIITDGYDNYDPEDYESAEFFAKNYSYENDCETAVISVKPTQMNTFKIGEFQEKFTGLIHLGV